MDGARFDALSRAVGRTRSRRDALRLLAGGALGGLFALRSRTPVAAAAPRITSGPVLVTKTSTGVTLRWTTDIASDSRVSYGTGHPLTQSTAVAPAVKVHRVALTGLTPNALYHIRVRSCVGRECAPLSADLHVRTCPASRPRYCPNDCDADNPTDPTSTSCCFNLKTDGAHCGGCATRCDIGTACVNGTCCGNTGHSCSQTGADATCCSGFCDGRPTLGQVPACCANVGEACTTYGDCCSSNCASGRCACSYSETTAGYTVGRGTCYADQHCCPGFICVGPQCLKPAGSPCSAPAECSTLHCDATGHCRCRGGGEQCQHDQMCCSGTCVIEPGRLSGSCTRCQPIGESCTTNQECCSRWCEPGSQLCGSNVS